MNEHDVQECLTEIRERLARIETKLSNGIPTQLKDHEKRLRKVERFIWTMVGVLVLLQFVVPIAIRWFWK